MFRYHHHWMLYRQVICGTTIDTAKAIITENPCLSEPHYLDPLSSGRLFAGLTYHLYTRGDCCEYSVGPHLDQNGMPRHQQLFVPSVHEREKF